MFTVLYFTASISYGIVANVINKNIDVIKQTYTGSFAINAILSTSKTEKKIKWTLEEFNVNSIKVSKWMSPVISAVLDKL